MAKNDDVEEEKEGKKLVRSERYYGRQFRSFTLGHDIDEAKAEAEYSDGVLKLTLPKKAGAETKKLTIKGALKLTDQFPDGIDLLFKR